MFDIIGGFFTAQNAGDLKATWNNFCNVSKDCA
jgi:hypothetical protein